MTKKEKAEVRSAVILSRDKALDALRVLKAKTRKGTDLKRLQTLENLANMLDLVIHGL